MNEVKTIAESKARLIGVPIDSLPTFGQSLDCAIPNIEITESAYHFVVMDRGNENSRKTTTDVDELLYWIFESVTFGIGLMYELNNRVEGVDFQKLIHQKQLEQLGLLDETWQKRRAKEIEK